MVFTSDFGAVIVTVAMKVDGVSSMLRGNDENMGGDVDGGRCGQGFGISTINHQSMPLSESIITKWTYWYWVGALVDRLHCIMK